MKKYILTENNYIVNHIVGETIPLESNQQIYERESITGSSMLDSKYDSSTDSFIPPTQIENILTEYIVSSSFPFTCSFSANILSELSAGAVSVENGEIISSLIDSKNLNLLINPLEALEDEETIKITIDKTKLVYDSNGRISYPHTYIVDVMYTSSVL
jgi:hypothetical protein